ncbi:hypothetical protein WJX84_001664 [Apatococcus fuscideae]|uniref:NAD(P)-binding domain-containing protein n=1 Tax=Apatococcus fuscideae TaxID=2026836 RepID=A0AAW1TGE3_9CHLO
MSGRKGAVLVVGGTGHLGAEVVQELHQRGYVVHVLLRSTGNATRLQGLCKLIQGDVSKPASLQGVCAGITVVISCLGVSTKKGSGNPANEAKKVLQKGLIALFHEAKRAGSVQQFVLIGSVLSRQLRYQWAGYQAREAAVDVIIKGCQDGNMAWTVVDPSAFFKDMVNILRLVKKGSFTGLGKLLDHKANPIHVQDLAARVVDTITRKEDRNIRVAVGGPETFKYREIIQLAADAWGMKEVKIRTFPLWSARVLEWFLQGFAFLSVKLQRFQYFLRFLVILSTNDSVGQPTGKRRLDAFFTELASQARQAAPALEAEALPQSDAQALLTED